MSKSDVYMQLVLAAANARHDGTSPERVEAARLTLEGKLPPLPPHVAIMMQTSWVEVPQVAISPYGKIAVLGIDKRGNKEIVEWDVYEDDWTSRVIDSTGSEMRVDHLHYPEAEDVEPPTFTVTNPDGGTKLFWGEWKVVIRDTSYGPVKGIFCFFDDDVCKCVVTYEGKFDRALMTATLFIEGHLVPGSEEEHNSWVIASGETVRVLGYFGDRIVVQVTEDGRHAIRSVGQPGEEIWQSDWYDQILEGSVMMRDEEFSFVGYKETSHHDKKGSRGDAFLVCLDGQPLKVATDISPGQVHCLKSGRILVEESTGRKQIRLRDTLSNDEGDSVELKNCHRIIDIVQTRSGMAIHAVIGEHYNNSLVLVDWETDTVWGLGEVCFATDNMNFLRRLGDDIIFQSRDRLQVIPVQRVEAWIDEWHKTTDWMPRVAVDSYPLYTDFDRLVPTNEGILGWHFVNGTFYIIRYELSE